MNSTTTATAEILAAMLTENTGRHMLDSGGDFGRHWQQNQGLTTQDFLAMPRAYITEDGVTLSVFHYILERATYRADLQAQYDQLAAVSPNSHYEDIEDYLELTGAKATGGDNTYNYDQALSQTIQWHTFIDRDGNQLALIQIHGGADVRGGYSAPRIFEVSEEFFYDFVQAGVYCYGCGFHAYLVVVYCYGCGFHAYLVGGYYIDYAEHGDECGDTCEGTDAKYLNQYRPTETRDWRPVDGCPCCNGNLTPQ
jgi:hypothetical protein